MVGCGGVIAGLENPTPIGAFVGPIPMPALFGNVLGAVVGATVDVVRVGADMNPVPIGAAVGPTPMPDVPAPSGLGLMTFAPVDTGAVIPPVGFGIGELSAACCRGCGLPFRSWNFCIAWPSTAYIAAASPPNFWLVGSARCTRLAAAW